MRSSFYRIVGVFFILQAAGCAESPTKGYGTIFYPPPPETPRVQYLTAISVETDLGASSAFRDFIVGENQTEKRLARPYGISHDKGHLYVADKGLKKIIILDFAEQKFSYIRDVKAGALEEPMGIIVSDDGYKYVADSSRGQVVVFDENDDFVRAYGEEKQFRPTSIAIYENTLYVCDVLENEIEVLDKESGAVLRKIGKSTGKGDYDLFRPTHVIVDKDGNLFVTDALNFRIQMFDKEGTFIRSIGNLGTIPGTFGRPKGIDVDREGHIYTADASFEVIQIFDVESAEPLLPFGKYGPVPGSTYMPYGVHIDYDNVGVFEKYADPDFKLEYLIYVSNLLGDKKLNVYGFGEWTGTSFKHVYKPSKRE